MLVATTKVSRRASLNVQHVEPWSRWAHWLPLGTGCHSCQQETGNWGYNLWKKREQAVFKVMPPRTDTRLWTLNKITAELFSLFLPAFQTMSSRSHEGFSHLLMAENQRDFFSKHSLWCIWCILYFGELSWTISVQISKVSLFQVQYCGNSHRQRFESCRVELWFHILICVDSL